MIDIFLAAYLRQEFTRETLKFIKERTKYPHRLFLLDNGGNVEFRQDVDFYVGFGSNLGIHACWNVALALAESDYFITTDNDLLVPDLDPDWLTQMVDIANRHPDYGAISMHPHVFIGAAPIDVNHPDELVERNMCGAVFRIMKRAAIMQAGGWEHKIDPGRNHEERTICGRLQQVGYRVGITPHIRAYHRFGGEMSGTWGYPPEVTPEIQGHNPDLWNYVKNFDNREAYDPKTWKPRTKE